MRELVVRAKGAFLRTVAERQTPDRERYHEPRVDIASTRLDAI